MNIPITNLKDLLITQLRELYNAEKQQRHILSVMANKASVRELRLAIKYHSEETDQHIKRLEEAFRKLDISSFGELSQPMQEIIKEGLDLIERSADPEVLDVSIITTLQYLEHFEIAGYGSACTYANELNLRSIADQLHLTLAEEKNFDFHLTEMAIQSVNEKAKAPIVTS